jgi:hypothetical protein
MAVSGFDADANIIGATQQEMMLQEMLTLAQGEQAAKEKERGAELTRQGGRYEAAGIRAEGNAKLLSDVASWGQRYAPTGGGGTTTSRTGAKPKPNSKPRTG